MSRQLDEQLAELLTTLLDMDVEVEDQGRASQWEEGVYATFSDKNDTLAGGFQADYYAANYLGGALTRIPPGGANDSADDGQLTGMARDNLCEVFNVCTRFFSNPRFEAVSFDEVIEVREWDPTPDVVDQIFGAAKTKRAFDIEVGHYGTGELSLLIA